MKIIDLGRGPQIAGSRITVLDVFYYLHRGRDFDFLREAMPGLTREQFDAVVGYVNEHRDELIEKDRQADAFHRRGREAQHARGGIFSESGEGFSTKERVARLKDKLRQKSAGANGCPSS